MNWPVADFGDVFADVSGGNKRIPKSALRSAGTIPVIDQGKGLVAGFVDDVSATCRTRPPVIVFGDHTRAVKYIDFDFAMGADGTKVLQPSVEHCARYLYYALKNVPIPNAGYSRHFKFLKESVLPLPPVAEQKRIARILDAADALRAKRRESIAQLDALVQSMFLEMFGDPIENPKRWNVIELSELVADGDRINYGVVQPGEDVPGGRPLVRVGDFVSGNLQVGRVKRISPEIEEKHARSRLNGKELLISCVGSIGNVATVPSEAVGFNVARAVARVPLDDRADRLFMLNCLRSPSVQRYFERETRTVSQPTLNIGLIKTALVLQPPLELQRRFSDAARAIEAKGLLLRTHLTELDTLFVSLQSRAFAGEL